MTSSSEDSSEASPVLPNNRFHRSSNGETFAGSFAGSFSVFLSFLPHFSSPIASSRTKSTFVILDFSSVESSEIDPDEILIIYSSNVSGVSLCFPRKCLQILLTTALYPSTGKTRRWCSRVFSAVFLFLGFPRLNCEIA